MTLVACAVIAGIAGIAATHGVSSAQVALRWNVQLGLVTVAKTTSPSRLAENLDVFDFVLTDDEMRAISALNENSVVEPEYYRLG